MVVSSGCHCCITSFKCPTILIFDSGVGGLFIYQKLRLLLPSYIYYLYFFDNEAFPYGERSSQFILNRVIRIFSEISQRHRLDLVILGCNTVTVLLIEKLRSYFFFPIIGVIPNIELGMQYTRNGIIGLLGTYRTVSSEFSLNIVNRFSVNYQVLLLDSAELVRVAEDKVLYSKVVSISLLKEIFFPWLNILGQPDTIILGCTHFLHLENELRIIFPKWIRLVGLSKWFVYHVVWSLQKNGFDVLSCHDVCGIRNQAYCSEVTEQTLLTWSLIFHKYNFSSLEEISI